MFNLTDIVIGLAVVTIVVSIWAIYYFIGRIIVTLHRWDEPSDEQLQKIADHYKRINRVDQHPR